MKKITTILFVLLVFVSCQAQRTLGAQTSTTTKPFITGTTIPDIATAADLQQGFVTPEKFGAIGNGINDDSDPVQRAIDFAIANKLYVFMPLPIYRVTRQIVAGYKYIDESDASFSPFTQAPSFNIVEYGKARFAQPLDIVGGENTVIWGDFTASKLTAVLYYGIIGGGNSANRKLQPARHGIRNITIVSQDRILSGNYTLSYDYTGNKQVGLFAAYVKQFKAVDMEYIGFNIGLLGVALYSSSLDNMQATACNFGACLLQHNATNIISPNFQKCVTGMYISGGAISITNFWAGYCATGIVIGAINPFGYTREPPVW